MSTTGRHDLEVSTDGVARVRDEILDDGDSTGGGRSRRSSPAIPSHPGPPAYATYWSSRHAGLVRSLALRFAHRGEDVDEPDAGRLLGLLLAIERFDPDYGVHFASFAVPTITGQLKRHFRDRRWSVRVPAR